MSCCPCRPAGAADRLWGTVSLAVESPYDLAEDDAIWAVVIRRFHAELRTAQSDYFRRDLQSRLAALASAGTVAEMRHLAEACLRLFSSDLAVGAIHDGVQICRTRTAEVTADIVEPRPAGPHPVLVYFHGGGFSVHRARDYRSVSFRFARAGYVVVNVDYRLAPETRFPGAYDDCEAAVRWVARAAESYGGDPSRVAVAGDSAGANLTAAVAVRLAQDQRAPAIAAALLLYGIYDHRSMLAGAHASRWRQVLDRYLGQGSDHLLDDPRVSPLAVADALPPSLLVVGDDDSLCLEQSTALARELRRHEVTHELAVIAGLPHGFLPFDAAYPEVDDVMLRMIAFLDAHLRPEVLPAGHAE
jgi:acetyl esterase